MKRLLVVPKKMRRLIVIKSHDLSGHFGVDKCLPIAMRKYWFQGMRKYFKDHIACCVECICRNDVTGKQPAMLHPIEPGRKPFEIVHMDFCRTIS